MLFSTLFSVWSFAVWAQDYKLEGNNLVLPTPITFKTGTANISHDSENEKTLHYIKVYLDKKPSVTLLRIEGHVSDEKNAEDAQRLSEKRAKAVAKALIDIGVDCNRLLPVGFGSTKPVEANNTPAGRAKNTRIVIANAELRSKAIGGFPTDGGGKKTDSPCQK
jgi:OOP family OmpA-OmpF porin